MSFDPLILLKRKRFEGGAVFEGPEGLEKVSVSARITSPRPEEFRARVLTETFGETLVTRFRAQYMHANRCDSLVRDEYSRYAQLAIVNHGRMRTRQESRDHAVATGSVSLLLGKLPFQVWMDRPVEVLQVYLPLAVMEAYGFRPETWAGKSWENTPSSAGLQRLMLSITGHADGAPERSRAHLGRALRELTLASLHEASAGILPDYDAGDMHRARARTVIAERFADPAFDVASLAAALHVSVRHLHTLFQNEEVSAGELLRRTRLGHAAGLLSGAPNGRVTIAAVAIASGFRAEDAFTRAFKRIYGITPSEYRRQAAAA